jgi:GMP synthase (glutamine-hydrolysing)
MRPQITVLDAGGQYCHLIARKVRDLGVYAEVRPSETPASELTDRKGIIISGGPSSVYEPGSPTADPAIFRAGPAVLGICYGQQLMAHLMDGSVRQGQKGEYGLAFLDIEVPQPIFQGICGRQRIWMSHKDVVESVPTGFTALARTDTCHIAAMGDPARRLYAVQFHPEVVHTLCGKEILSNFLFEICGCERDWSPRQRIDDIETQIRRTAGDRHVFFFVSGGVDSTVAYTLCLRALGPERVRGAYVDTGLMREGETEFVRGVFHSLGDGGFSVEDVQSEFLTPLAKAWDPEHKREIIGEQFVAVQEQVLESGHYLEGNWILGQGTIYPDTIESGGTARADKIKTHHNRVPGIQRLIDAGRVIEPLSDYYKDEVRQIGRELGLPAELLDRHPFPGPGLAIRCLCAGESAPVKEVDEGVLLPIRSVGVQGDARTYRSALALEGPPEAAIEQAPDLINRLADVNRVVTCLASHAPLRELGSTPSTLSPERLGRLRCADAIVRRLSKESGFDRKVWQFPVVLIPVGTPGRPDSVVLRPIDSVDGMTASAVVMDRELLGRMTNALLEIDGVCAVFYDLSNKPPATIEWE